MMIQIKDGDPDIVKKFQRRGPKVNDWVGNFGSGRLRSDVIFVYGKKSLDYDKNWRFC